MIYVFSLLKGYWVLWVRLRILEAWTVEAQDAVLAISGLRG